MSFPPGGGPPPPPPVPPQTPWGRRDPEPAGPDPSKPGSAPGPPKPAIVGGLALALAVSLAVNAIIALRVKDESDQQTRLREQVAQLQAEVDTLRRRGPETGGSVLDRIASSVAELRMLAFKKKVVAQILTDAQLRERIEGQFSTDNPRKEIDQLDKVLTAFGLVKPDVDLYTTLLEVQTEQVAGYYDTEDKRLVVGGDANNPTPLDRVLLAHEYTHALTDQHFDLTRFDELNEQEKDDEALAYLALVEGDATVMMGLYAQQFLTPTELQEFFAESTQAPTQSLDRAPNVIRRSLLFPYEQGVLFARALMDAGGTGALDRAYKDPPTSTEQILHVTKYTSRRDEPTPVTLPGMAGVLGRGWKNLEGGGIGEFDIRLLVDEFLTRGDAESAGDGWDGGRFAAAESSAGVLVAMSTVWDSESEAREATDILGRWLPNRFGNKGADMGITGSGRGWDSADGAGLVLRNGTKVILLIGPDRAAVERARTGFPGF
ncbi:MAG TPA: hypothetical protein VJ922_08495 [Actinomycetota bacterium]|nr:hypothetical protein [Actinomycetota bacterium]